LFFLFVLRSGIWGKAFLFLISGVVLLLNRFYLWLEYLLVVASHVMVCLIVKGYFFLPVSYQSKLPSVGQLLQKPLLLVAVSELFASDDMQNGLVVEREAGPFLN